MSALEMFRGDNAEWEFAVKKPDGTAQDISGATLRWMAKAKLSDVDGVAIITATTANGKAVITNAATGLLEIRLVPADSSALVTPVGLFWDLQIRDAASKVWTVDSGKLAIRTDVSVTVP